MALSITVDIEPTNRCNASCYFCPRDQTPHQGLMSQQVFDRALARVLELRDSHPQFENVQVSLCGLGEPLINPKTPSWVQQIRDAGFDCAMSSNGALLDERRGTALLEAGLQTININVGDEGERYEDVYKLPFQKTLDNILRFKEMAGDGCKVNIVLVDYRLDREHIKYMVKYWQSHGFSGNDFVFFDIMNRGGALFVDHMQFEQYPELDEARRLLTAGGRELPICGAPFIFLFVGYDGQYYLCCSDWKKEVPLGSVFDGSFLSIVGEKLHHVSDRTALCRTCNWDPLNRLTEVLRAVNAGAEDEAERDRVIQVLHESTEQVKEMLGRVDPALLDAAPALADRPRKRIPLTTV